MYILYFFQSIKLKNPFFYKKRFFFEKNDKKIKKNELQPFCNRFNICK